MFDDTALMRLIIEDLAEKKGWSYEDTLDRFYRSETCKYISDPETGMFTFSHLDIIRLFEEEESETLP